MKVKQNYNSEPSQRQLRVGEQVRHALAEVFMRGESHIYELEDVSVTISEVRLSPDMKHAHAYISVMIGEEEDTINKLNEISPLLRKLTATKLKHMKYTPKLHFRKDDSFNEAHKISELLNRPEVQKDIHSTEE